MKYYILSILLIASVSLIIPDSFAQVEKGLNYDQEILSINPDGSKNVKWVSHFERFNDNGIYKDYIFTETATALKIQTSAGFVSLDKNSCGFNFDNKFTDSIVAYASIVDLYSWQAINQINGATCEAYYDQGNNSLVAKRYASGVGFMEYKYIFNNGSWKTQLEATNLTSLTNRVFAFDQTIDLNRDTINYGGSERNLDNFHGQTFDRAWLENNEGKLMNFLNGVTFDFDLGFENLDSISITNTGANKSKLTFHYMRNNNVLNPNETLIIDPTFGYTVNSVDGQSLTTASTGTSCSATFASETTVSTIQPYRPTTTNNDVCIYGFMEWDTTSIPDGATVSSINVEYDIITAVNARSCDWIHATSALPDGQNTIDDAQSGTVLFSNDSNCITVTDGYVIALDSSSYSLLEADLTSDRFGLVINHNNKVRDTLAHYSQFRTNDSRLEVTYSTAPPIPTPDSITDLSLDSSTQTTATVSFSAPNLNTGNLTTYTLNLETPQTNNVLTFNQNFTNNPLLITGLTLGTSYSANATAITEGGANYTLANVLNFTTPFFTVPSAPTLSASALSDTAIRYTSVPGTAGDNSTIWYSMQCELNGAGGWLNTVNNNTYTTFYEVTGLTLGDVNICQWRDGSVDGWSSWSNNATDTLTLAILSAQRGIADTDDKLMQFINMVSGMGGVYFGLGVLPFGIMLIGFMAGKKTVRIFTLATLMLMGIVHASGYYVYPNWYWTLCLLFGLVLIMGRMKSD